MNEIEIWKPIPQYEGYEASNLGRIRSIDRKVTGTNGIIQKLKGKVLNYIINKGYKEASLSGKRVKVSILVMMAFKGYLNNDWNIVIDHKDGIKKNDKLDNLQTLTHRSNIAKGFNNSHGYTGVYKHRNKWGSLIQIKGVRYHLGLFNSTEEASIAYESKLKEVENGRL